MNKQSINYKCYAIFCGDYKAKNIFEKIYYIVWKLHGVSPFKLQGYLLEKYDNYYIGEQQSFDVNAEGEKFKDNQIEEVNIVNMISAVNAIGISCEEFVNCIQNFKKALKEVIEMFLTEEEKIEINDPKTSNRRISELIMISQQRQMLYENEK